MIHMIWSLGYEPCEMVNAVLDYRWPLAKLISLSSFLILGDKTLLGELGGQNPDGDNLVLLWCGPHTVVGPI